MDLNNPYAPSAAAVGAVGANPANPAAAPTAAASSHHHPLAVGGAGLSYQAHPNAQPSAAFLGGAAKPSASMAAAAYAGAGAAPYAVAKSASFASTANLSSYSSDEDEEAMMPWERDNWVPTNKSGKQKTPNMVSWGAAPLAVNFGASFTSVLMSRVIFALTSCVLRSIVLCRRLFIAVYSLVQDSGRAPAIHRQVQSRGICHADGELPHLRV